MVKGLQLEHAQQKIKATITGTTLLAPDKESKIHDQRRQVLSKIQRFCELQAIHMPGAIRAIEAEEAARDSESLPPTAENIRLWLPSDLSKDQRKGGCSARLVKMETELCVVQCSDMLAYSLDDT
ncbi:hypothetical protein HGRIS_011074 [Hohenbuehelia grisea]|uniref:Uncharacterized protein n=1 Tax=Hohenbuehelia grisea TaxID=104357 RepID=A0ABR3IYT2_9AGAR